MAMHSHSHHHHSHAQTKEGESEPNLDPHDQHSRHDHYSIAALRGTTILNSLLVAIELSVGLYLGSMALLGDATHNLGDVMGLILAWVAARLARRRPNAVHTYGYARSTILAALANSVLLLVTSGILIAECMRRFFEPHVVPGLPVILTAGAALLVNLGSAWLLHRGAKDDLNIRGAYLHMASDAAVSAAAVIGGVGLIFTGWLWIDPVLGLVIAIAVLWSGWAMLREALALALDAVPRGIDLEKLRAQIVALAHVHSVHDLHVWPLSTTVAALTAHVEHDGLRDTDALLHDIQQLLQQQFSIEHATIQFERRHCDQKQC